MNTLAIFAAILAVAAAKPLDQHVSVAQDTLGTYKLKFAIDGISRAEERNIHGDVSGGYAYVDPHGQLRKLEFTSGEHGFIPISGDLPLPVHDTPEVAHAKAEHLALLRAAELQHPTEFIAEVPVVRSHTVELPLRTAALAVPEIPFARHFNTEVVEVANVHEAPLLKAAVPVDVFGQHLVDYTIPSHSKVLITRAHH